MTSGRDDAAANGPDVGRRVAGWTMTGLASTFLVFTAVTAAGCRRPHVDGTVAIDTVLGVWNAAGFDTKAVVDVKPESWSAGACSRGAVSGLDVLLCEYGSDAALVGGQAKVMADWEEESVPTGAVARASNTLLAVADRSKGDPEGRTIAKLVSTFQQQR